MNALTVAEVLGATGGRLIFGKPNGIKGISIDSRTIKEGQFFLAIKGERFDGHEFVPEALKRGSGAIVSVPPVMPQANKVLVHVPNTLLALHDIAHYIRQRANPIVVGITGTNGKTTTKEMTSAVLGRKFGVLRSSGNLNNQVGLPLSIMGLAEGKHDVAVLEMGASYPGDIKELCGIAAPDIGVLTNIGQAHLEGFKDIAVVRRTKLEMMEFVGAAAVNGDDAFLMDGLAGYRGRLVRFGMCEGCEVSAAGLAIGVGGSEFMLRSAGAGAHVRLRVPGMFNVYNALAAASVGMMLDVPVGEIADALNSFEPVSMRLQLKSLHGATVISDVYNANPSSMEEAVKELIRMKGEGRAVAVLGDMLELGSYSEAAHRRLGQMLATGGIGLFIAVGQAMAQAAEEFERAGGRAIKAADSVEAAAMLRDEVREADTVLVKGSRGMRMERVLPEEVKG